MKRRDFLKKGAIVVGLGNTANLAIPLMAENNNPQKLPQDSSGEAAANEENRSAQYLRRMRVDEKLPKPAEVVASRGLSGVPISPMLIEERLRRGVVPQRGFCSIAPASDALLISGDGHMTIDLPCDPYSEQIYDKGE